MNRLELLKSRRSKLLEISSEIRAKIADLIDTESFVELSTYSFSKNEFYGEEAEGEGVVTGFATIDGNPVYIVAQNGKVLSGGISKANCDKICKTIISAANNSTPIVYLLDTKGVQVGEGVAVLEGVADVLYEMNELRGKVTQFAIVDGDCFGAFSLIAAGCDFTFYTKNACVAYASPTVIAATSKQPKTKGEVGGVESVKNNAIADFTVETLAEARNTISSLLDVLSFAEADVEDDYNRTAPNLNEKACPACLTAAAFDEGTFIELGKGFASEVTCGFGRVGGMSVGAIIFGGEDDGVSLTPAVVEKISSFVLMVADYDLPLVNFVNTK